MEISNCATHKPEYWHRQAVRMRVKTPTAFKSKSHFFSYRKSVNTPQGTLIHFSSSLKDEEVTEQQQKLQKTV